MGRKECSEVKNTGGRSYELRRRMSKLSNSDIEQVANAALGEVTRRNSNRYEKTSYYSEES